MRTLVFTIVILFLCALVLAFPHVGVLTWVWISLGAPHKEMWGGAASWNWNMIIVVITVLAWMFSREPKYLPSDALSILVICFLASLTLSATFSLTPKNSWDWWNTFIRSIVLYFPVLLLLNSRSRLNALIWVIVITFGQHSVKGGGFTLATGGSFEVRGPEGMLGDRNGSALSFVCTIPLIWYLFTQSANRWVRYALLFSLAMTVIAVLGTYSRGGLVALVAVGAFMIWRTRYRVRVFIAAAVLALPALFFMPAQWTERISTINTATDDASFMGRVDAWVFAVRAAVDRPLVGAGILATQNPGVFQRYAGETDTAATGKGRAAHSIYFQVLGDTGFLGFALYLGALYVTWRNLSRAIKASRGREELRWIEEMGRNLQCSLAGFLIGGAALSLAYFGLMFVFMAVSVTLRGMALAEQSPRSRRHEKAARSSTDGPKNGLAPPRPAFGTRQFRTGSGASIRP
jgi:probable O-glycosylation ligase (exosortase A-associated)